MTTHVNANKVLLSLFFCAYTFVLFACASVPVKNYDEVVSQWRSYEDVANWMERNYSYDREKFKNSLEIYSAKNLPHVKTPQESFEEKSGLCFDAAYFAKQTLNRIDPAYEAKIVFIQNRP